MSKCVIKHIHLLEALAKAKPVERKAMLEKSNFGLIKSIVECIENLLDGNVRFDKVQLKKLKKYKNQLRKIYTSGKKWTSKKNVIVQTGGGFLPALLVPIISALAARFIS